MHAITQKSFVGLEVLELTEAPRPQPLPTKVLIHIHATSVNPVETFVRASAFPLLGKPPFILSWDVSGVVDEVVPGTSRFRPAMRSTAFRPSSQMRTRSMWRAPSRQLARKPVNLDHAHAAALPLVGLTAWQALVDIANNQLRQRVLIHGADGGVGHIAVQIAKALDAHGAP